MQICSSSSAHNALIIIHFHCHSILYPSYLTSLSLHPLTILCPNYQLWFNPTTKTLEKSLLFINTNVLNLIIIFVNHEHKVIYDQNVNIILAIFGCLNWAIQLREWIVRGEPLPPFSGKIPNCPRFFASIPQPVLIWETFIKSFFLPTSTFQLVGFDVCE